MSSVNQAIIVGRLGKAPELKLTQSGTAFCQLSIATSESWTDQSGAKQEKTEWHRVMTWKKLAEQAAKFLSKGSLVYIQGRLETRSWEDSKAQKQYMTEIVAEQLKFLSSPQGQPQEDPRRAMGKPIGRPMKDHGNAEFGDRSLAESIPF